MSNIITDISTLTTIPERILTKLIKKANYCICESVAEDSLEDKDITEIFIGIGTLYIKHNGGEIKYHFEPSDALQKAIMQTSMSKTNPLEAFLNDALNKKFSEIYKDLC